MFSSAVRAGLGLSLVSSWLTLLFVGWTLGGGVHLLLAAALVIFPWRDLPSPLPQPPDDEP
jgi:hypothetical protein